MRSFCYTFVLQNIYLVLLNEFGIKNLLKWRTRLNKLIMFILALLPVLWLMISLGASLLKAHLSALSTLLMCMCLAVFAWGMSITDVLTSALEGAALGLWPIIAVIIAAIFTYKLSQHTKSIELIKQMLSGISTDNRIQVLILAWGFGGFLEAISGYGTSVAIPASILVALGFEPVFAAVLCLVANTVPTAYGAVGIAVTTLSKVTDLEVGTLNFYIAVQLALLILLMPFVLVMITTKSLKGLKGVMGITAVSGISFMVPQLLAARFLSEELPTLMGSICSLAATILWANLFHRDKKGKNRIKVRVKEIFKAWLPYLLIFIFILVTSSLFPRINAYLGHFKTTLKIYSGSGATPMVFKWVNSPGTLIVLAAVIGGLVQGAKILDIFKVFYATLKQMVRSVITVVSIVAVAKVMSYSGMITAIATVLVKATGAYYPLISPVIGTLGTFVTGSDTSSNILFGALQKEVAVSIQANPYWLAAANTSGATAGKMISPQSIAVATSATGMIGLEGKIFKQTLKFCVGYIAILSVLIYIGSLFV